MAPWIILSEYCRDNTLIVIAVCYEKGHKKGSLIPKFSQKDTIISDLLRYGPHCEKALLSDNFRLHIL